MGNHNRSFAFEWCSFTAFDTRAASWNSEASPNRDPKDRIGRCFIAGVRLVAMVANASYCGSARPPNFTPDEFAKLPNSKSSPSGDANNSLIRRAEICGALTASAPWPDVLPGLSLPYRPIAPGQLAQRHQGTRQTGSRQLGTVEEFYLSLAECERLLVDASEAGVVLLITQGEARERPGATRPGRCRVGAQP